MSELDEVLRGADADTRNAVKAYALWRMGHRDHPFLFKDSVSERDLAEVMHAVKYWWRL